MRSPSTRAQLLALAHQLLTAADGQVAEPISITIRSSSGTAIEITSQAGDFAAAATAPAEGLSPLERSILRCATPQAQTAKRLAGETGSPSNSYFRSTLTAMVRRGLLERTPDGYRLPPT